MLSRRQFLKYSTFSILSSFLGRSKLYSESNLSIAVIGAGMAGIAAANALAGAGCTVRILEARNRIGGRIHTDSTLGTAVDLGATWIHGKNGNPITSLANNFNVSTINTDEFTDIVFNSRGKQIKRKQLRQAYQAYRATLKKARQNAEELDFDISIETAFFDAYQSLPSDIKKRYGKTIAWILRSEITEDLAADTKYISTWWYDEDEAFPGPDVIPVGGYTQLLDSLLAERSLSVELGTLVQSIDYSGSKVVIQTNTETILVDRVVVTVPLGVLKAGDIIFSPALPSAKHSAIQNLSMGVYNKLILKFPEAFWNSKSNRHYGFIGNARKSSVKHPELNEYFDLSFITQQAILIAFFSGDFGVQIEQLSVDERIEKALIPLKRIYGSDISQPTATLATNWYSDPYSRGSYSFIPVGARPKDYETIAESIQGRVFFAGEATTKVYPATVHGAYLSGLRVASEALAS